MSALDFRETDMAPAIAVLPVAAVEQHGPHLPVGVDLQIMQGYLDRVIERLPGDLPAFSSPIQSVGASQEHTAFPRHLVAARRHRRARMRCPYRPGAGSPRRTYEIGAAVRLGNVLKNVLGHRVDSRGGYLRIGKDTRRRRGASGCVVGLFLSDGVTQQAREVRRPGRTLHGSGQLTFERRIREVALALRRRRNHHLAGALSQHLAVSLIVGEEKESVALDGPPSVPPNWFCW